MERDQLLKGAALLELGVVEAVDEDVGRVRKAAAAQQMCGRGGENGASGSSPSTRSAPGNWLRRPEHDRAMLRRLHQHEADVRVGPQGADELRMTFVDLLLRQPPLKVHEIDEPEVAGAEHHDLRLAERRLGIVVG